MLKLNTVFIKFNRLYGYLEKTYFNILFFVLVPEHIVLLDPDLPKHVLSSPNLFSRSDLLNKSAPFYANGLLMARGQHHEWQKKILSRAFTPQKLRDYSQIMDKHADILIKVDNCSRDNRIDPLPSSLSVRPLVTSSQENWA